MAVKIEWAPLFLERVSPYGCTTFRKSKAEWPTVPRMKGVRSCEEPSLRLNQRGSSSVRGTSVVGLAFSDLSFRSGDQADGNELDVDILVALKGDRA